MHLLAFLGVSLVVIVTPGQDTALTIKNTLAGGRGGGVFTAIGVASGQAIWSLAAAVGVAALLRASEPAFLAVRLFGACYLVFLGGQALVRALRRQRVDVDVQSTRATRRGAFRQGLLSNLGNPKMAVFFTSLLPQFGAHSFGALLGLGLVFCSMTLIWLCGYGLVVAKAGDLLRRTHVRRGVDGVTGTVLVALGVRLATEARS